MFFCVGPISLRVSFNGGFDDHFFREKLSPATDRGQSVSVPATDILGVSRFDDPGVVNFGGSITDIGAYEFRASSLDTTPPTLTSSTPAFVHNSGTRAFDLRNISLTFSKDVNPIEAGSSLIYELRGPGENGSFDNSDDAIYQLNATYDIATRTATLTLLDSNPLPVDAYRLTLFDRPTVFLHDLAANRFDGDANGVAGGSYVRVFNIGVNVAPVLSGANPLPNINENVADASNFGMLISDLIAGQVSDTPGSLSGIAVSIASSLNGQWQYRTNNASSFQGIAPLLAGGSVLLLAADSDTRIRFVPNAFYFGTDAGLAFRAWDQADETAEGTSILPSSLLSTALSQQTANASLVPHAR